MLSAISLIAASAAAEGPCDIVGKAGNPCVAAHSTVRVSLCAPSSEQGPRCSPSLLRLLTARPRDQALFAAYDGPLYNVSRPDGTSKNIGVLKAGGFADIKTHDGEPPERCSAPRAAPLRSLRRLTPRCPQPSAPRATASSPTCSTSRIAAANARRPLATTSASGTSS